MSTNHLSHQLTSSVEETHAKRTQEHDRDTTPQARRSALSSSALFRTVAHALFSERIQPTSAETLPGLGGSSEQNLSDLAILLGPSECEPVALALTTSGTDCSCLVSYPTPTKRDWKGQSSRRWRDRPSKSPANLCDVIGGPPHPEFCEALMGFPTGWSALPD